MRIILGGVRIGEAEQVAAELDERVLESAAVSQVRQIPPASELDPAKHAVEAAVRTAGNSPNAIEVSQAVLGIVALQYFGGKPTRFSLEAKPGSRVEESRLSAPMATRLALEAT